MQFAQNKCKPSLYNCFFLDVIALHMWRTSQTEASMYVRLNLYEICSHYFP